MNEELELFIDDCGENMDAATKHLEKELLKIRAGRASVQMLDGISVDYYGTMTPLNQISNMGCPDPKTIAIQPWEKSMIEHIEKAILKANLGFNPANNGEIIRINVPPLTEERRKALVRQVKTECENGKVAIRNIRRDTNEEIKRLKKEGLEEDVAINAEEKVQRMTDINIKRVDDILEKKEKDIMTV